MDMRKETIKTEGRKPLLDAFQLVGISWRNRNSVYLFTCKLNSPEANYKASTSAEEKTHTYKQNTKASQC
jgi:hypothetical protein